jgi:hypothetical protein
MDTAKQRIVRRIGEQTTEIVIRFSDYERSPIARVLKEMRCERWAGTGEDIDPSLCAVCQKTALSDGAVSVEGWDEEGPLFVSNICLECAARVEVELKN